MIWACHTSTCGNSTCSKAHAINNPAGNCVSSRVAGRSLHGHTERAKFRYPPPASFLDRRATLSAPRPHIFVSCVARAAVPVSFTLYLISSRSALTEAVILIVYAQIRDQSAFFGETLFSKDLKAAMEPRVDRHYVKNVRTRSFYAGTSRRVIEHSRRSRQFW